jgi:hypothetical protein
VVIGSTGEDKKEQVQIMDFVVGVGIGKIRNDEVL